MSDWLYYSTGYGGAVYLYTLFSVLYSVPVVHDRYMDRYGVRLSLCACLMTACMCVVR